MAPEFPSIPGRGRPGLLTRRAAIRLGVGTTIAALATACAPIQPAAAPTAAPKAPASAATVAPTQAAPAKPAAQPAATQPAPESKPAAPTVAAQPAPTAKPAADQPRRGGKLVWARPHDVANFDTVNVALSMEPIVLQVFSTLIRLDDTLQPQPELAESWELSSDYTKLQLKLRRGVTFHSGKPMTAAEVIGTFQRHQDPKSTSNVLAQVQQFKTLTAPDPYTVEIGFDQPMATVFDVLDFVTIQDPDNVAEIKAKPNGTGPFKLAEWQPGNLVRMVRHDGFYKSGQPYLDEIEVRALPDFEALLIALETGNVDMGNPLRPNDKARLEARPGLKVGQGPLGTLIFDIALNATTPPLNDKRVRQAVSFAINRQRFVTNYLAGLGQPWSLPWPSASAAYDRQLNDHFRYDPERAKQLLAEAGQAGGFETTILATRQRAGSAELAELVQNDLAQVGIRAKIDLQEQAAWNTKMQSGEITMASHAFARSSRHPASLFGQAVVWRSDKNSSSFVSDEYRKLTAEAAATFDPAKSREIFQQINKLILDEAFTLVIAPSPTVWGGNQKVNGIRFNPDNWGILEGAWLSR